MSYKKVVVFMDNLPQISEEEKAQLLQEFEQNIKDADPDYFNNIILNELKSKDILKNWKLDGSKTVGQSFEGTPIAQVAYLLPTLLKDLLNIELDFTDKQFSQCELVNLDMSLWNLKNTSFYGCTFKNCTFDKKQPQINFSDCTIEDCNFNEFDFGCIDATNTTFKNVGFVKSSIDRSFFTDCTFDNVDFGLVYLKPIVNFASCKFNEVNFSGANCFRARFFDTVELVNVDFTGANLSSTMIEGFIFDKEHNITLNKTNFTCANISKASVKEIKFDNVILDRTVFSGSVFNDMHFEKQMLSFVWFDECVLNKIDFKDCNLAYAKFSGAKLRGVNVEHCIANNLFASKAEMIGCNFIKTDLSASNFAYASLLGCMIKDCDMTQTYEHDTKYDKTDLFGTLRVNVVKTDPDLYEAEHFY